MSKTQSRPQSACPICGQQAYTWGYVQGYHQLKFKSEDTSLLEKFTILGGNRLSARLCDSCGNVQLFAKE
jgi:hypothetical protein